ncbi:MAG: glutamate racemase [Rhodospirillaceae bacterium]|jgi:glutamate racemase|nr:glutamate racemase [Rhodospirillaceae bacterium]
MIGLFDSGFGGLTILRAVVNALPHRHFLYFGDHATVPYGNREREDIYQLTLNAVEHMFNYGCCLVILACNTSTATSLRRLQQEWLPLINNNNHQQRRILGILVPIVEAITDAKLTFNNSKILKTKQLIAVFATKQTVLSNAYPLEISKRASEVTVIQQACPQLVDLIETGATKKKLFSLVCHYVDVLLENTKKKLPDIVILGCTHYNLIADLFATALPNNIEILSQPNLVTHSLVDYLRRHPEFDKLTTTTSIQFLTTGDPNRTSLFGSIFFGSSITFEKMKQ